MGRVRTGRYNAKARQSRRGDGASDTAAHGPPPPPPSSSSSAASAAAAIADIDIDPALLPCVPNPWFACVQSNGVRGADGGWRTWSRNALSGVGLTTGANALLRPGSKPAKVRVRSLSEHALIRT